MRRALLAVALVATTASADPAPDPARPELRFGLGAGEGKAPILAFDTPEGTALALRVAAGWWVSPEVTFGVHLGYAGFTDSYDDPRNTPHHSVTRYSALQAHATFLYHWRRVVAGGGLGFDRANESLLETDGMSRNQSSPRRALGVHVEVGVDIVRLGPVMLGVFGIASGEPVPLDNHSVIQLETLAGGLSVTLTP